MNKQVQLRLDEEKKVKQSLDEFLLQRGLYSPISNYLIDKLKGNRQVKTYRGKERFNKEATIKINQYHSKRKKAVDEYNRLVKEGKIISKTHLETSLDTSKGFYEKKRTQAARRMCLKRGVNWLTGEPTTIDTKYINMLQLTINEYDMYKKELISKINTKESKYSFNDFVKDISKVYIINLNL